MAIRFRYEHRAAAEQASNLDPLLEAFCSQCPATTPIELTVARHGSGFLITQDSSAPRMWLCRPSSALVPFLEWLIHQLIAEKLTGVVGIHAGAVGPANRPILLIGGSGVGKSTLVFELMKGGWHYWSDDLALIDGERKCLPYPKPIKFEGRHPHGIKYPRGTVLHFRVASRAYRYVRPWRTPGFHWGQASSIHSLVVLARDPTAELRLTPLSPARAVEALLAHACVNKAELAEQFELMCHIGEEAPAARLSMGQNPKDNVRLIREFTD